MTSSEWSSEGVEFLYLSQEQVISSGGLDLAAAVEDLERLHVLKADGDVIEPTALVLPLSEVSGHRLVAHAAWVGGDVRTGGLKWIPASPANITSRGIPRATALLILTNGETGLPLAVMDGTLINAVRTAASTSVAIKHLARPNSTTVALIGAGVSNQAQPLGLEVVAKSAKEIKVYDIDTARARRLLEATIERGDFKVEITDSPEEAVRGSDVVITGTLGVDPKDAYIRNEWIKRGALLCAVSFNDATEELICSADRVVTSQLHEIEMPETRLGGLVASGKLRRETCTELGDVIKDSANGRTSDDDIIYYSLYGFGAFDTIVGRRIYETAQRLEIGTALQLWKTPHWV